MILSLFIGHTRIFYESQPGHTCQQLYHIENYKCPISHPSVLNFEAIALLGWTPVLNFQTEGQMLEWIAS